MTVDGKIATVTGDSRVSSHQDLVRVHTLRSQSHAILVGISTILADDPQLTVRLIKGRNPARVIVDSLGRIPMESKIIRTARDVKTIIAVTSQAAVERIQEIRKAGAEVLITREGTVQTAAVPHGVDLKELFRALSAKMGFERILVEGGGELNWSLLRLGLVNEVIVTIAPIIAGGRLATTLVEGDGAEKIAHGVLPNCGRLIVRRPRALRI